MTLPAHQQLVIPSQRLWVAAAVLVLGTAFYVTEQRWDYSTLEAFQLEAADAADDVATGKTSRKAAYAAIAVTGLVMFFWPSRNRLNLDNWLILLAVAFFGWCFASVLWSDSPPQTAKRLGALLFCLLGVLGVSRRFSARQLVNAAAVIAACYLMIGVLAELLHGTFVPWEPGYRFAGTVHPNTQGAYAAILGLSAHFGMLGARGRWRWGWLFLLVLATCMLLLTKSRSNLAGFAVAIVVCQWLLAPVKRRAMAAISSVLVVTFVLLILSVAGLELVDDIDGAASLGRQEGGVMTLNGRVPLWQSLLDDATQQLLIGHGYGAYWTPDRVARVSDQQEWTVPNAHSVYVDLLLELGLVGLLMYLTLAIVSLYQSYRRIHDSGETAYGFAFTMLLFGLTVAVLESGFIVPVSFDSFVAACGVALVAFRRGETRLAEPAPAGEGVR